MYLWRRGNLQLMIGKTFKISYWHIIGFFYLFKGNQFLTEIYSWECLHLYVIWKSLGVPCSNFQGYQPGTFISIAMDNPFILFIFSHVLKHDKLKERIKMEILEFFKYSNLNSKVFKDKEQLKKNYGLYLDTDYCKKYVTAINIYIRIFFQRFRRKQILFICYE